ncbi:YdcF family protein [Lactobacillus sp. LL6]|uniref:YdcF family protein n=1 Tax=Lactobacillus sp. LL6 TaxID=2596827 RepID=UPI0011856515|nr:YdcF family protein [Lactobacillus sp. LL6]TSO27008.1 hypothetical protein FOD82_08300 [Lactobacillus sp. LL6]
MHALFQLFQQNRQFSIFSAIMLFVFFMFLISWLIEPRRLVNGMIFTLFIFLFAIWVSLLVFATNLKTLKEVYTLIVIGILMLIAIIAAFSWLFFLWNAYFVWKYESHTLPNLLTLFIGIGLIITWVIAITGPAKYLPNWLNILLTTAPVIAVYLLWVMYNFLINSFLYQFVPRRYDQDYLIVLGAGLINGERVTPLLATRINRAIQFAQKQVNKGHKMPKIIMSGGKGPDEKVSEAQAMTEYAIARGISPDDILLEDKSRNTYENMLFSKEVAKKDYGNYKFKAKFFSNNYHIFRAALYAKMAGLNANGIGCYTRFYFLPNAIIREFAGVFVMNKKRHFIIISLITVFFIIQALFAAGGILKWRMI